MAAFLERIGIFPRAPDPRPVREIEAEVEDELGFHVDASTQALVDEGMDPDAARAEALRRFGDLDQVRRACVRTSMGERLVLQRIQFVLTAALLVAVVFLVLANRTSMAQAAAERARTMALMAELQARLAAETGIVARVAASGNTAIGRTEAGVSDRAPAAGVDGKPVIPAGAGGELIAADGRLVGRTQAVETWQSTLEEQRGSWRHGLRIAERLAALPGSQGPEILRHVWAGLSVEHREQIMKPFVFGGGHPHALEVLELGFEDDVSSVKERAVLYLHTYAWENLWRGQGTGESWFARWRDRPLDEVLRANAMRWAGDYAQVFREYKEPGSDVLAKLLSAADPVRIETLTAANVDLGAILRAAGACGIAAERLTQLTNEQRQIVARVESWCGSSGK